MGTTEEEMNRFLAGILLIYILFLGFYGIGFFTVTQDYQCLNNYPPSEMGE